LWKALLSVATGKTDSLSALTEFLRNLNWEAFEKLPAEDLNFFVSGKHLHQITNLKINTSVDNAAPSQEFSLLSRANEGEVNEGWLLANLRPTPSPQSSAQDPQIGEPSEGTHLGKAPTHIDQNNNSSLGIKRIWANACHS